MIITPYRVLREASTSATANADGSLNSVIQYTAYGVIRLTQGVTPTKYRYTGQLAQAELGLDYYVARWYDPMLGHFTQADSIIPEPGKSQSFDRYAYVMNNPLRYFDPSGHDVDCAGRDASECQGGINHLSDSQIQLLIYEKHHYLYEEVKNGDIDDLHALGQLSNFAASFSANNPSGFIRNMGAVLTGLSKGFYAIHELMAQAEIPIAQYNEYYYQLSQTDREELMQSGYDEMFCDPNYPIFGGNQAHHVWFYVQLGFESGLANSNIGNLLHETILGDPEGMSINDFALGFEGSIIGQQLKTGEIKPLDVGKYFNWNLRPYSPNSQIWRFVIGLIR